MGRAVEPAQARLPRGGGDRRASSSASIPASARPGAQVSFSTDLIYDVLRRYEPDHLLMRAAWNDARARMTELGRLARLVDRAAATMVHVDLDRITPMAVPLMVIVGREGLPPGSADEALLFEAEGAGRGGHGPKLNPASWDSILPHISNGQSLRLKHVDYFSSLCL